jgi:hypothetical protein
MRVSIKVMVGLVLAACALASAAEPVKLFNGKDMTGWTYFLNDGGKMEDVWSITPDGVLHCKGHPTGYIRTEKPYTSYKLKLEWRNPGKPGNSGVLMRMQAPDKVWPKSIEAQLNSNDAGDIWNIDEFPMTVDPARTKGRHTKKLRDSSEKPLGEWNQYEITLDGENLELKVNGVVQKTATNVKVMPGPICLQSEGAEIEFRNIELTPLGDAPPDKPAESAEVKRLPGLEGWHISGNGNWKLHDGIIEGQQTKDEKTYTHVVTDKTYKNLRASLKFKCLQGNSGFYFRSMVDDKGLMHGIQAEIDEARDPGSLYESYGRQWVAHPPPEHWQKYFKPQDWNEMTIEAIGNRVVTTVNGQQAVDFVDDKQRMEGVCALQIHGGQDVHVMFKDIKIEELP